MIRALGYHGARALLARPTLQLLLGAALISTSPVFVKLTTVPSDVSAWYRVMIGGAVLAIWQAARGRWRWPSRAAWWPLLLAGVFFALDLGVWHQSIHYIGPGMATLLGNFQVFVMAMVGALVFRERLSPSTWISIPLALLGLSMITGFDAEFEQKAAPTPAVPMNLQFTSPVAPRGKRRPALSRRPAPPAAETDGQTTAHPTETTARAAAEAQYPRGTRAHVPMRG